MKPFWGINGLFNWWSLRSVGNLVVLKVSYPVLALTPFISEYKTISKMLHLYNNSITLAAFFASLMLAMANLLYDIFCPVIVKRFDSPNTMYKEMLEIKSRSLTAQSTDQFDASIEHCKSTYNSFAGGRPVVGSLCAGCYVTSLLLFGYIFFDRVWIVVAGIF